MTIEELILNVKDLKFEELVWQNDILSEKKKAELISYGYGVLHTKDEFEKLYNINPAYVCYTKSVSTPTLYFNRDTLAVCNFPMFMYENGYSDKINLYEAVSARESEAANRDYTGSLLTLPDSLRFEYFNMMVDKGLQSDNLYELFLDFYIMSDYGFYAAKASTVETVIKSKMTKDIEETQKKLSALSDTVTIYRGHTPGVSTPIEKTMSWSLDIKTAIFFAIKNGASCSEIVIAEVPKDKIIEYVSPKGEEEIWVKYENIHIKDRIHLYGEELLGEVFPSIQIDYGFYLNEMKGFDFISDIHGQNHTKRVLLHILILCHLLNVSGKEKAMLCMAAIYHDLGRVHDNRDDKHGFRSKQIYEGDVKSPHPIISFLIEYHSRMDSQGLDEINNNPVLAKEKDLVIKLYNIFKDADALDRIRLGPRDLDIGYLRLPESKQLIKVARLMYENIK